MLVSTRRAAIAVALMATAGCDGKVVSAGAPDARGGETKTMEKTMDPAERRARLEALHDWPALAEELERGIASAADTGTKASLHLELGRVLEEKLLRLVPALKNYQDAYKLDPSRLEALRRSRSVYWDLGKTNMVRTLLGLELKGTEERRAATALLVELGDVLCDLGEWSTASTTYAQAVEISAGESREAQDGVGDLKLDKATFRARIGMLLEGAAAAEPAVRGRRYMRAARLAKRFAPAEVDGLLALAYAADPRDKAAAAAYEQLLVDQDRADAIVEAQRRVLEGLSGSTRGEVAFLFGARWAVRHQNPEVAAPFFEEALKHDPSIEGASLFLRNYRSRKPDR